MDKQTWTQPSVTALLEYCNIRITIPSPTIVVTQQLMQYLKLQEKGWAIMRTIIGER